MRACFHFFALFIATCCALAEAPFAFEKTPGQLPKDVVPKAYAIELTPSIEKSAFTGSERIAIEVRKPTRELVLNALGLQIGKAILREGGTAHALTPKLDEVRQTLTLPLDRELPPGSYELELEFSGKLNEQPFGLYIARYQVGTEQRKALATQMEATDARRMFPCWDEPVFRATFQLTVLIPQELGTVVSNMPLDSEHLAEDGTKRFVFAKTPSMASYLVALFIGDFEVLEDEIEGVKLRAFTTPGKREQARYALDATKLLLPYFNEYFGTKYPLPKLDQIALPSTGASGMENWGAIVYNDTAFLYDPATSSQSTKERVFEVVAHEIAHQWFGDLVTMSWWDNLWLNEGFASWMGTKATDKFNPEWQAWLRAAEGKEWAMSLDARATTRAIQQPIKTEAQASDAFDEITYQKGQAFIRMLESYLGEQAFRDGLRLYMTRHAYSSTTTADLWKALEEVSGKPVSSLAAGWTGQPGFPVVKLREADSTVEISQERFTLNQPKADPLFWAVPVVLGPAAAPLSASVLLLKDARMPATPIEPGQALKANIGDVGYYRVWYDDALFKRLYKAASMMATADQLNLLNDAWAMSLAERAPVSRYLDLVGTLGDSPAYVIVDQIIGTFWSIDHLQRGQPGEAAFHAWATSLLRPHFARVGWDAKPGEKQLDALLRSALISQLGHFGDEVVLGETQRRFAAFLENPESLPGDLRRPVLGIIGRHADAGTWEKLHALGKAEPSTEQKRMLYRALASTRSPDLAARALAISLSDELAPQHATGLVRSVGSAGEQPALALKFAQANLDALLAKLGALDANEFIPGLFRPFTDAARADELEAFAKAKLPPSALPQVAKAADEIRFNASLKKRLLPDIDAWCRARSGK